MNGRRHLAGRPTRPRPVGSPRPPRSSACPSFTPRTAAALAPLAGNPPQLVAAALALPGKLRERMNSLTRRRFLLFSGAAAVAATAAGVGWKDLADRTRSDPLPVGAGVLVLVTLYGGNDGLEHGGARGGRGVPVGPPRPRLRRRTRCSTSARGSGSTPALAGLKQQWDGGTLAIVRGVSYPKPDHSHFRSMDIWQTASPDHPAGTGWIGRWLDANGRDPLTRRLAGAGAAADAGGRDHRGRGAARCAGSRCPAARSATAFTRARAAVCGRVAAAGVRGALDHRPAPHGRRRSARTSTSKPRRQA